MTFGSAAGCIHTAGKDIHTGTVAESLSLPINMLHEPELIAAKAKDTHIRELVSS